MKRSVVAVVGPTASGKSRAALALASKWEGEIVNGDSRQVFRGMDIGTAKPSLADRSLVPHHLYDICEPGETYSLARYRSDALAVFDVIWGRGNTPWLVGGTGQYIWSLHEGWTVPAVPPDPALRRRLEEEAARDGVDALHERLKSVDPIAASRIDARNVRRVIRALEVFEATGAGISSVQTKRDPGFDTRVFGLSVDGEELRRRIEERTGRMFESGLVAEVRSLLAQGVPGDAPSMSSIGYAEVLRHLDGEISVEEAKELTIRATRRLARRQRQWFRHSDERIFWASSAPEIDRALAAGHGAAAPEELL